MRNDFQVFGDITVIHLQYKGQPISTMISTKDLSRVSSISGRWYAMDVGGKRGEKIYVGTKIGGVTVYLHQVITMNPPKTVVDHYNHNTLDNRRENLRVVSYGANAQNRKGAQKNNRSTGLRNVYRRPNGKFIVRLTVEGNQIHIGTFDNVNDANRAAKEARRKYFPFSLPK